MSLVLTWQEKTSGETKKARFDVVTSESLEAVMVITAHPVEQGANVADHAREDHQRITIEGFVSNKPLWSNPEVEKYAEFGTIELAIPEQPSPFSPTPGGLTRSVTGFVDKLLNPPQNKATVLKPTGDFPDRDRLMYELLESARVARALVRVTTRLAELENMLIERVATPRTPEDGNGTVFQVDLARVRLVASETVNAPVPVEERGAALVAQGSKSTKDGDKKKEEKLKSVIANTFDGAAGLAGVLTGGGL